MNQVTSGRDAWPEHRRGLVGVDEEYLDGKQIGTANSWSSLTRIPTTGSVVIGAGFYVPAVAASNPDGPDPAGLILSVHDANTNAVLLRTDNSIGSFTNSYRYDLWENLGGCPTYVLVL